MHVLNPADNSLQTFDGLVLSICNLLGLRLLLVDSTLMLLVEVIPCQNVVHETSTLYKSILRSNDIDTRFFLLTSALFAFLTLRLFSVFRKSVEQRLKEKAVVFHGYVVAVRVLLNIENHVFSVEYL